MDEKMQYKAMKRSFSTVGWALLLYTFIMNTMVSLVSMVETAVRTVQMIMSGGDFSEVFLDEMMDSLMNNGWGYLLTIVTGYIIMRLWKGKEFCRVTLWQRGKPMTAGSFLSQLCILLSAQLGFQIFASVVEWLLNLVGLSAMPSVEAASMTATSFSMFLYMGIGAPIGEELLFRGLVMRSLEPYGKRFAIFTSAFLFGIFHGNLVQSPYAFVVGLVLGYAAMEHNIAWAMVLHMFNNLVFADILTRVTSFLPEDLANLIMWALIIGSAIAAVVILIVRRKEVSAYRRADRIPGQTLRGFFTSAGILVITIYMLFNILLTLVMQLI